MIFMVVTTFVQSQVVFESSLEETFKKAKEQNKPVFIEYYSSECSVCKRLGELLKNDSIVAAYYNEHFINYAINAIDPLFQADKAFVKKSNLYFQSVPMLVFFDNDKNYLHHSTVSVTTDGVIKEAEKAQNPDLRKSSLKAKYDQGDRTVKTLYAYCDLLVVNKNTSLLEKVSQELFEAFKKEELPTKKSYLVLKQMVNSTENGFFQYWINNLDKLKDFEKGYKAGTEKQCLEEILLKELRVPDVKNWEQSKKDKYKDYILKLKITDNPELFFE